MKKERITEVYTFCRCKYAKIGIFYAANEKSKGVKTLKKQGKTI